MKEENVRKKLMLMKQNELIKKTDTAFQLMRRLEEADSNGICKCISCGRSHHYLQMHGGHYVAKSLTGNFGVRYHRNNVFAQCAQCNWHLSGNVAAYRERLVIRIGKEAVEWLEENKELKAGVWLRDLLIETYISSKKRIKALNK